MGFNVTVLRKICHPAGFPDTYRYVFTWYVSVYRVAVGVLGLGLFWPNRYECEVHPIVGPYLGTLVWVTSWVLVAQASSIICAYGGGSVTACPLEGSV